jgi:hypothetical protein
MKINHAKDKFMHLGSSHNTVKAVHSYNNKAFIGSDENRTMACKLQKIHRCKDPHMVDEDFHQTDAKNYLHAVATSRISMRATA